MSSSKLRWKREVGAMIDAKGLVKEFSGGVKAVSDVSFAVPKGEILGFLGPNGAGKTTTMKMLTGYLSPTRGTATVDGYDIQKDPIAVRERIGYLPESAPSYGEMTVAEFLKFVAEIRRLSASQRRAALSRVREVCFLASVWQQPIETLSKGFRQRVGFAQAMLHDPPVLILDEPTDGLDPNQKHEVRQLIRQMAQDKTIILSTHILEEVEAVCGRVLIISQGKLVADSSPDELMQRSTLHNAVTLKIAASSEEVENARRTLSALSEIEKIEDLDGTGALRVFPRDGRPIVETVSRISREHSWPLEQLHVEQGRLDEVFRQMTRKPSTSREKAS